VRRAAADLGEHRAVGAERVGDEPRSEERRAHALGLGRLRHGDDDAGEPQRAAVLRVERADHRVVLGGPRRHAAAHEAAQDRAVEDLVGVDDRRQHAPYGVAVEDALVDAGRPLMRVDLEDVSHARQVRQLGRDPRRGRQREDLDAIGLGLACCPSEVHGGLQRRQPDGGEVLRAPGTRRRPRRDHEVVSGAERRERRGWPGHVDHRQRADAVHLLVGRHHRHAGQRQRPSVAGPGHGAQHAGEVVTVQPRPRRDHVEDASDTAALARVHQVEPDAGEPGVGRQERAERVEIDFETLARQPRGGSRHHVLDVRPAQLESQAHFASNWYVLVGAPAFTVTPTLCGSDCSWAPPSHGRGSWCAILAARPARCYRPPGRRYGGPISQNWAALS
jgi:hypothetical protein